MDIKKSAVEGGPEEPPKAEVPYYLVTDSIPCIFRERDSVRHEKHRAMMEGSLGVFGRIKRKIRRLFDNQRVTS